MSELLVIVFLSVAVLMLSVVIVFIFVQLYQIFDEPAIQKRVRALRKPVQPWVTVLLYSHNNEADSSSSLKALLRNHYQNYDIVIVNDYSQDAKKALRKGYAKSEKGEIVISLQAGAIVEPTFIKRAVAMKHERKQVTFHIGKTMRLNSLTEIYQSLNNLLWQRAYKVHVSDAKNILAPKNIPHFDFVTVLLFVAIVSLSVIVGEPIILWYSWLIFTSYLLAIVWLKKDKIQTKMQLSFSVFSALFILPVVIIAMRASQFYSRN